MALVEFRNISKEYSGTEVLANAMLEINPGQKVGLTGPNGAGKTTILRILCGQEKPDTGSVNFAGNVRVGYVPQHVEFHSHETVMDYLMREHKTIEARLREAEKNISEYASYNQKDSNNCNKTNDADIANNTNNSNSSNDKTPGHNLTRDHNNSSSDSNNSGNYDNRKMEQLLSTYQDIRDEYDNAGGDYYESRALAMLDALGLTGKMDQSISSLSGGEKNVLAMTRALLKEPNLLILDEPGNHLDYMGLAWLDEFLQRFRGALLLVSHNRYLLDRVVTGIYELDRGKLIYYPGNYSESLTIRAERLKAQQAAYDAWQGKVTRLEALVRKFADIAQGHASDSTWGKRLKARRTQLKKLKAEAVEKPRVMSSAVRFHFKSQATQADIALQLHHYSKAFGDRVLLDDVSWTITGGERWALVGDNGVGKTSLLRDIVQLGRWEHKSIRIGPSLSVGYCSQEQEILHPNNTAYEELFGVNDTSKEQAMELLARFLFKQEDIHKKVHQLSGGERNRLQLARVMLMQPNFLILDEPTNHLDIATREVVENALMRFAGTLLVVSHDRYFLDKIVTHVAEIRNRKLLLYDGNFTNYWHQRNCRNINTHHNQTNAIYDASQTNWHGKINNNGNLRNNDNGNSTDNADGYAGGNAGGNAGGILTAHSVGAGRIAARGKSRKQDEVSKPKTGGQQWKQRKQQQAELRKARRQVEKIENDILKLEDKKEKLAQQIAAAYGQGENDKGNKLSALMQQINTQLQKLEDNWEAAGNKLAEIEKNTTP